MIEFLNHLEYWLRTYPQITSVVVGMLSAIGTWAAVLYSLWLTFRRDKPHIKALAGVKTVMQSDGTVLQEEVISLELRNLGKNSCTFQENCASWKVPFLLPYLNIMSVSHFGSVAFKVEPGQSTSVILNQTPRVSLREQYNQDFGLFWKFLFPHLKLYVMTAVGDTIEVRIDKELRRLIKDACRS